MMQAEAEVHICEPKNAQDCQPPPEAGRGRKQPPLELLEGASPADHAFFSDLWPPTERMKACCSKHLSGGALWWQPQDMITVGIQ